MTSIAKFNKVQLVFPKHDFGHLARENEVDPQPPLGLIVLASYLKEKLPNIEVEVFDGKRLGKDELIRELEADVIGLSVWFSNYDNAIAIAKKIKEKNPNTWVVMGGPHATAIADRIINQNPFVDAVVCGEGEIAFTYFLQGKALDEIPGFVYRSDGSLSGVIDDPKALTQINLDSLPLFDLESLRPRFLWKNVLDAPAMSAFPLSGIRGCCRKVRCEYCTGHFHGFRSMKPENYWAQVELLNDKYNIDYFFETGDTLPPNLIKKFSRVEARPKVGFRIYSYLGYLDQEDMRSLKEFGVVAIFMGVESVLIWNNQLVRKYPKGYDLNSLFYEIEMLRQTGIDVITSFILGLPGETNESLRENLNLIRKLHQMPNIHEITVSVVLPIPGSSYFKTCLNNSYILKEYYNRTHTSKTTAEP